jgi:PAS domain S-box-containing protein
MSPDWKEMRYLNGKGFLPDTFSPDSSWLEKYIDPVDQPQVLLVINKAIITKSIFALEHRIRLVNGALGWTFSRAMPLINAKGEIEEWLGYAKDITPQIQAEQALRESEGRFGSILDNSTDIIYRLNLQTGKFDYLSPSAHAVLGYDMERLLTMSREEVLALVHPEDLPGLQEAELRVLKAGKALAIYRQRAKNGEYRWISNHMTVLRDSSGRPLAQNGNARDITDDKNVEEKLWASEVCFRAVQENSLDRFTILKPVYDRGGKIVNFTCVFHNAQAALTTGRKPEDLANRPVTASWPGFLTSKFFTASTRVIETGQIVEFEDCTRSDGVEEWIRATVTPIPDGVAIASQIITERKKSEEIQRKSAERQTFFLKLSNALRSLPDAPSIRRAVTDLLTDFMKAPQACYTGFEEDCSTEQASILSGETDPPKKFPYLDPFGLGQEIVCSDVLECPELSEEQLLSLLAHNARAIIAVPVLKAGKLAAVLSVWQSTPRQWRPEEVKLVRETLDWTWSALERTRVEEELSESKDKYRELFDAIDEGFCIVEVLFDAGNHPGDYRFLEVNQAFEKQTGLKDAVGRCMRDMAPDHEQHWYDIYGKIALTGEPVRFQAAAKAPGHFYDVYAFRVGKPNQRQVAILFNDINERKNAEDKLRKSEKHALNLIEKLEAADRSKNQFISSLSHELRNPLASMMMSLSLLKLAAPDSEEAVQAREIFERQTIQLSRLVDDLLEVTRISQNKITLRKEVVELNNLIAGVVREYKQLFAEKGVLLEFYKLPQPVYLYADPARLTQAIGNLLHNALKFTDKDGKTTVGIVEDRVKSQAQVSIEDTGLGMGQEQLHDLFRPFNQADRSLDRSNGGLGLGLVIVKGMVELHNGTITADSTGIGKGSRFVLSFPLLSEEKINGKEQPPIAKKPPFSRRVLVIEDIEDIAEIICSLLRHLGHDAISSSDGARGLALARDFKPDVVFCDIGLPGMNGYEVAKHIRNDEALKDILLIALSGYAQPEDEEKSLAAGFNAHLAKPVDLVKIEAILKA